MATNPPAQPAQAAQPAQPAPEQTLVQQAANAYGHQSSHYAPYQQHPGAYGRHVQSYYQQPLVGQPTVGNQPPMPMVSPTEPLEVKSWAYTKGVLHAFVVVFSIVALGLTFGLIGHGTLGSITTYSIPGPAIALLWSGSELVARGLKKFASGLHPGAHVGFSLILWLAFAILGGAGGAFVSYDEYEYSDWDGDCIEPVYDDYYGGYSYDDDADCSYAKAYQGWRQIYIAYVVFICFLWLFEFILFIGACIDTAKRNNAKRRPIMVVNPAQYWPANGPQGWQQLPPDSRGGYAPQMYQQPAPVPQMSGAHGAARAAPHSHRTPDVPLQDRTPSPVSPHAAPAELTTEKAAAQNGQPESSAQGSRGVTEFYAPGGR
jgi:hypothetical protein